MVFYNKLFISMIIVIATIFFVFTNFSYAEFNQSDSLNLNYIKLKLDTYLTYLVSLDTINVNVSGILQYTKDIWSDVSSIQTDISLIQSYDYQTLQQIKEITEKIDIILNACNLIFDKLDNIDSNIENMNKYLYDAFFGTVLNEMDYQVYPGIGLDFSNHKIVSSPDRQIIVFPVESQYLYEFDGYNFSEKAYLWYSDKSTPIVGDLTRLPITSFLTDIFESSISGPYRFPYVFFETELDGEFNLFFKSTSFTDKIESNADKNTDKITNSITSSDISDDTYNIDTSFSAEISDESYNNFLTNWINTIISAFSSRSSTTLEIPMPFDIDNITISSDVVSSQISGTLFYTLIQVFWYFLFGTYFFRFGYRAIHWLTSGEIVDKGPSAFADYLMKQNAVITSDLM